MKVSNKILSVLFGLLLINSLCVVILAARINTLDKKLLVYKELTMIWDVKDYCKKKVRVPNRCNITVSVGNID